MDYGINIRAYLIFGFYNDMSREDVLNFNMRRAGEIAEIAAGDGIEIDAMEVYETISEVIDRDLGLSDDDDFPNLQRWLER
ncbi:MAG: hypothetical protein IKP40_09975 [Clostridia bacterium]|nr:hypothetical protein [Clostridia bacterium]